MGYICVVPPVVVQGHRDVDRADVLVQVQPYVVDVVGVAVPRGEPVGVVDHPVAVHGDVDRDQVVVAIRQVVRADRDVVLAGRHWVRQGREGQVGGRWVLALARGVVEGFCVLAVHGVHIQGEIDCADVFVQSHPEEVRVAVVSG